MSDGSPEHERERDNAMVVATTIANDLPLDTANPDINGLEVRAVAPPEAADR